MMEWAWSRMAILSLVVMLQAAMGGVASEYMSAVGDPGMRRDGLRVAFEGWNFCNEVGQEAPAMGSPRAADCFELQDSRVSRFQSEDESLNVKQGGGPKSQFYLTDIGGCWKNTGEAGEACDGNVNSDVTRYSEMILNPYTQSWCSEASPGNCPPFHGLPNGTRIHRSDANRFPFAAYHMYCAPGNAEHLEEPYNMCDAYSNPQPQEIVQIVPHPAWGVYGYPTKKGEGWIGDPREWELDVGGMSQALFFYQDPGTSPAKRRWTSVDVGTEIYVSGDRVAEWTLSGFDILVPKKEAKFLDPDSVFKFR